MTNRLRLRRLNRKLRKIMIRVAMAILFVLFFYNFVAIGEGETTQLIDLRYKSWAACALGIVILTISYKWWATAIAAIEFFLLIVNLHVAYNWQASSIFDPYYPQIQFYACVLEILILCVATLQVATDGGRPSFNNYFNRSKHSSFSDSHSGPSI